MKKLIAIVITCLPLISSAQIGIGRSFLSGGTGFNSSSPENPEPGSTRQFTRFNANAMYGILVRHTWAVGVSSSYQTQRQTFYDNSKNQSNTFGVGPFVRKYFGLGERFFFHVDLSYAYSQQEDFSRSPQGEKGPMTRLTGNTFAFTPGASYFVTDRIALQAMLGELAYRRFKNQDNDTSEFDVNFDISSFSLGASVFF